MKKRKKNTWLPLVLLLLLTACNNKVDINSEYEDISIVYGLLNQSQSRHYVKLTKAFQTDGNVYLAAADGSIQQYDPGQISMRLKEYSGSSLLRSIAMDTVRVDDKDSGVFYYPQQMVWATPEHTFLNEDYSYQLVIENRENGKTLEARTELVHDFAIVRPNIGQKYIGFTSPLPISVEWRSGVNGKLYQLVIRFYYTEVLGGQHTVHHVDMPLQIKESRGTSGGETMTVEYYGSAFYENLAQQISLPQPGMVRYPDSVFYIFSVADETFSIYMDLNKPATGIVQERPSYTNIENGIGLFAGRYNKPRKFIGLTSNSIDTLIYGVHTYNLGFQEYPVP